MIIPDKKLLFIHIPKCAGTFIERNLIENTGIFNFKINGKKMRSYPKGDGHVMVGEGKHNCINYYKDNLSFDEFSNLYKFTFIRNPFARLFSLYKYMQSSSKNKFVMQNNFKEWTNLIFRRFDNGDDYTHLTGYSIVMKDYISYNNNEYNSMDLIGRVENLEEDFAKVCVIKDLTQKFQKPINPNKKSSDSYRVHYSNELQKICEKMFEADLNLFNYDF